MPVGQEEKEGADSDVAVEQQEETADEKQADAEGGDATETEAEEESAKEEVHPALTVTSPGSGAQFPSDQPIAVEFDCEGDAEFTARVSVLDANGTQVQEDSTDLQLDAGKGHGAFSLGGDAMLAGKYDVLVWGESNGQSTAVQKIQVEVVDTEAKEEVAPAVAVEGDDGDGDDLQA
ncbi:MAG: hypothetical protein ACXVDD_04715 [Polyangia bacterium]